MRIIALARTPRATTIRAMTLGLLASGAAAASAAGAHHVVPDLSPLVAATAMGLLAGNLGPLSTHLPAGLRSTSTRLLRAGVALLGLQLGVSQVRDLGGAGLAVVVATVAATFLGTRWLGARIGVGHDLSLLIATGFAICGASAIAAMAGVIHADEDDAACSIALVTLCGTLAIGVLPALRHLSGLHAADYGAWVGASVHDVGQVVAAAAPAGASAERAAVVVKLTRVLLLAPILTLVSVRRGRGTSDDLHQRRTQVVPPFVALFLVAVVIRSTGIVPLAALRHAKAAQDVLLSAGLFGLGSAARLRQFRRLGSRPLLLAASAWLVVLAVSYVGVVLTMSGRS